jgi:phage antirepressor YoqD-like protein
MQEGYEEELERLRILNAEKEKQLQEQAPKVDFYDCVTGSSDTMDMKEVAKVLNYATIGRNKLYEILRNAKILDRNNLPYQKYVDAGYFRIIESRYTVPDGEVRINLKTVVFQKGLNFIRNVINKNIK